MSEPQRAAQAVCAKIIAPIGFPQIEPGAPISAQVRSVLADEGIGLYAGDIVVLAQKVVSKAEGRYVSLASVTPSAKARDYAAQCAKDPRLVELILSESSQVVRCKPGVIIVRHRLGFVLANAGIDHSNVPDGPDGEQVLLLPKDPDRSALRIRAELMAASGNTIGVAIIDSFGRAWRVGTTGTCIGASGLVTVDDLRGRTDLYGRPLVSSIVGIGDEVAAAASMLMGQSKEGRPLVILRGMSHLVAGNQKALDLIRPAQEDLFP
ncbi:coenzyme F420-0:L-glutamate ligase [Xanthobacteraceae bacterium A53D]